MITVKAGTHKVVLYNGIKEMPMRRYNQMQSYLMQDSGIGSTMADVDQRMKNIDAFLSSGKLKEAIEERQNLHFGIYSALENISYKSLSFACLVHSIDGKLLGDSDDDFKQVIPKLDKLTMGQVVDILDDLKKNCVMN